MAYNPNIPEAGDVPRDSQNQILENFQELNSFASRDHVALGQSNSGQHARVTLPQGSGQSGTNNAITVYSEEAQGNSQLFLRRRQDGSAVPVTSGYFNTTSNQNIGYSYFPNGVLMKYGTATTGAGGRVIVDTALAGSSFSDPNFLIQLTPYSPGNTTQNHAAMIYGRSGETFEIRAFDTITNNNITNLQIHWTAIGDSSSANQI